MDLYPLKVNVEELFHPKKAPQQFIDEVSALALRLSNNPNEKRHIDKIVRSTILGFAAEEAFTKKFPQFVRKRGEFYDYDVSALTGLEGTRIEIKNDLTSVKWWIPKNYGNFYRAASEGKVDYICNMLVEEDGKAQIRAIANARSYERYVTQGPYNTYYNQFHAAKDGECWLGLDAVTKIKTIIQENSWDSF